MEVRGLRPRQTLSAPGVVPGAVPRGALQTLSPPQLWLPPHRPPTGCNAEEKGDPKAFHHCCRRQPSPSSSAWLSPVPPAPHSIPLGIQGQLHRTCKTSSFAEVCCKLCLHISADRVQVALIPIIQEKKQGPHLESKKAFRRAQLVCHRGRRRAGCCATRGCPATAPAPAPLPPRRIQEIGAFSTLA